MTDSQLAAHPQGAGPQQTHIRSQSHHGQLQLAPLLECPLIAAALYASFGYSSRKQARLLSRLARRALDSQVKQLALDLRTQTQEEVSTLAQHSQIQPKALILRGGYGWASSKGPGAYEEGQGLQAGKQNGAGKGLANQGHGGGDARGKGQGQETVEQEEEEEEDEEESSEDGAADSAADTEVVKLLLDERMGRMVAKVEHVCLSCEATLAHSAVSHYSSGPESYLESAFLESCLLLRSESVPLTLPAGVWRMGALACGMHERVEPSDAQHVEACGCMAWAWCAHARWPSIHMFQSLTAANGVHVSGDVA